MTESPSTEVTRASVTDEEIIVLQSMATSIEQLGELFANDGRNAYDDDSDGILSLAVIDNKNELVGIPFMILRWRFTDSDKFGKGGSFVSMEIAYETVDPKTGTVSIAYGVLNDGSTGIRNQMMELTKRRMNNGKGDPFAVRAARGGLRVSNYVTDVLNPKTGQFEPTEAHTYYVQF